MGRKKIKSIDQVARVSAYVKRRHHARVLRAIREEIIKIKIEELQQESNRGVDVAPAAEMVSVTQEG
jgi:hypothetical protein